MYVIKCYFNRSKPLHLGCEQKLTTTCDHCIVYVYFLVVWLLMIDGDNNLHIHTHMFDEYMSFMK